MQELTVKSILGILKKRMWLMLVFCIIVTFSTYLYYQRQPDEYTAQTTLYVLTAYVDTLEQTRYDTTVSAQFAGDFKELIKTPIIMDRTIDSLGLEQKKFDSVIIDINAVTGTRVLRITATSSDSFLSMRVANTVSQVFTEYIQGVMKADVVTVAAEATLPLAPSGPPRARNTVLALCVSLMLAIGTALVIEMMNTSLRSTDDVESLLGLPVLASIHEYKKDMKRFLQKRSSGETFLKAVPIATKEDAKTLAANLQFTTIARPVRSLLITSSIAGEGKSSLVLLLAEALSDLGKRVLVVDMDIRNPSVGKYLGARGRNDLFDYLAGHARLEEVIYKTASLNINFIDSRHRLVSVSQIVNLEIFDTFLDTVNRMYDLVLFDTPPLGLFIDAAALAHKMDATLLVVGNGMADRAVIKDVVGQLHKANANIVGVAMNFSDRDRHHGYYYKKNYGHYDEEKGRTINLKKIVDKV